MWYMERQWREEEHTYLWGKLETQRSLWGDYIQTLFMGIRGFRLSDKTISMCSTQHLWYISQVHTRINLALHDSRSGFTHTQSQWIGVEPYYFSVGRICFPEPHTNIHFIMRHFNSLGQNVEGFSHHQVLVIVFICVQKSCMEFNMRYKCKTKEIQKLTFIHPFGEGLLRKKKGRRVKLWLTTSEWLWLCINQQAACLKMQTTNTKMKNHQRRHRPFEF